MTALTWKQPPPRRPRTRTNWPSVDEELRKHPGEWARVAVLATEQRAVKLTSELRYGKSQGHRSDRMVRLELGAFEFERRGREVYARYVGAEAVAS